MLQQLNSKTSILSAIVMFKNKTLEIIDCQYFLMPTHASTLSTLILY